MQVTDLMHAADPATRVDPPTAAQRAEILDDAVAASDTSSAGRPRNRRLGRIAVGIAASLVIGGAAFQSLNHDGAEAQAAEVLRTAAIHATDPPVKPGQYWEITQVGTWMMSSCDEAATDESDCDSVVRAKYLSYVETEGLLPSWTMNFPLELVKALGSDAAPLPTGDSWSAETSNLAPNDVPGGWQSPSPAWLSSLPRDTNELRAKLAADTKGRGRNNDDEMFVYVADVLRSGLVPADLRSALFEVLATVPGTRVVEDDVTVDGVHGVAIGPSPSSEVATELVIDPAAGQVMAERERSEDPRLIAVALGTTYSRRLVDAVPSDVQEAAVHGNCTVQDDGAVTCTYDD
ncbi:MAG: CU044_5270 family protein [Arachnia sp.]